MPHNAAMRLSRMSGRMGGALIACKSSWRRTVFQSGVTPAACGRVRTGGRESGRPSLLIAWHLLSVFPRIVRRGRNHINEMSCCSLLSSFACGPRAVLISCRFVSMIARSLIWRSVPAGPSVPCSGLICSASNGKQMLKGWPTESSIFFVQRRQMGGVAGPRNGSPALPLQWLAGAGTIILVSSGGYHASSCSWPLLPALLSSH
jgi:hypothetical protein